eukprot:TRINITY_DN4388_c0_g1_i2.p1 TRINITY_DN4388_c0_g1~~TRINITY_DN4388_c0_g1_i2.p1  ORF type:complete len:288 (+),score=98.15 TRINITY_DN4388_c0_g1_i2:99-962(+)
MRGGEEEEYNDDQNGNYGDEPYDDNTPQKRKRGRPKGSTKTTNKKPKAELAEGESKLKMGRAWYAVNDVKREFRYFTGLQEGEVPCSKKEEKEVKRRLNGYTRLLSNGRSKIAIFEDVDKDQQEQDMQQDQNNNNFENVYPGGNGDYGQQEYHYQTGTEEYQNQDYQNQQQHLYHQQMYQQNQGEGEHNYQQYQEQYQVVNGNDGNTYSDPNVYHNTNQDHYNQSGNVYQTGHQQQQQHEYTNLQQYGHEVYQQNHQQQDPSNYHAKSEKNEDDDEEYQPGNEEEEN